MVSDKYKSCTNRYTINFYYVQFQIWGPHQKKLTRLLDPIKKRFWALLENKNPRL